METITVIYEPLGGGILGINYYHETLAYTNSAGVTVYASAGPNGDPTGPSLYEVSQAASAVASGGSSNYGTMFSYTGTAAEMGDKIDNFASQISPNNPSEVIAESDNLSTQWNSIVSAAGQINGQYQYSPLTLNSNSAANTELTAAGIAPPSDSGFFQFSLDAGGRQHPQDQRYDRGYR